MATISIGTSSPNITMTGKQKKALLVGSSFSAAPIFFALKKYDLYVAVCGNNPQDPCHQYADKSFFIDYSKPEELQSVVDREHFDFLVPSCNDYSYMSATQVAAKRNFIGFDLLKTATILHTKDAFRQVTEKHQLPALKSAQLKEGQYIQVEQLRLPVLVKPIDSFSGRGVTKLNHVSSFAQAIKEATQESRTGEAIVEEYVDGTLHSQSAFVKNGRIAFDFFVDEYCSVYPYQVNCSNHPSTLSAEVKKTFRNEINRLIQILHLSDGLLHTQFIVNGNKFWIIECMRRCPGDLYGSLIEFSTAVDYMDLFIRPFIGADIPEELPQFPDRYYGRHTISVDKPLVNFSFSHSIPSKNIDIVPLKQSGEKLAIAPFDKLAILFAEFGDKETMLQATPQFAEHVKIKDLTAKTQLAG